MGYFAPTNEEQTNKTKWQNVIRHCFPHPCSGLLSCTAGRQVGSGGTARPAPRALADTGVHTGARAGGGALGSSGSGWRSFRRKRSPAHSSGTPGPTGNPWGKTPDEWTPSKQCAVVEHWWLNSDGKRKHR